MTKFPSRCFGLYDMILQLVPVLDNTDQLFCIKELQHS